MLTRKFGNFYINWGDLSKSYSILVYDYNNFFEKGNDNILFNIFPISLPLIIQVLLYSSMFSLFWKLSFTYKTSSNNIKLSTSW